MVGHEDEGMENMADDTVQHLAVREAAVAAATSHSKRSGHLGNNYFSYLDRKKREKEREVDSASWLTGSESIHVGTSEIYVRSSKTEIERIFRIHS